MGLVPLGDDADVTIAVVALGNSGRLASCLESLVHHEARARFDIVCVVNPETIAVDDFSAAPDVPDSGYVEFVYPAANLGWAGGLHLARHKTTAKYLVWMQDDVAVEPGWLDAAFNVAAELAAAGETVGAVGSVSVDARGTPVRWNGGAAKPIGPIGEWSRSDITEAGIPNTPVGLGWVGGRALLTPTSVWDEVGGADPRLFPLIYVDREYCAHVRAHGHRVILAPGARLRHGQSLATPGLLGTFLYLHHADYVSRPYVEALASVTEGKEIPSDHLCRASERRTMRDVERLAWQAASVITVAFARWVGTTDSLGQRERELFQRHIAAQDSLIEILEWDRRAAIDLDAIRASTSWRATAPFRAVADALRGVVRVVSRWGRLLRL